MFGINCLDSFTSYLFTLQGCVHRKGSFILPANVFNHTYLEKKNTKFIKTGIIQEILKG